METGALDQPGGGRDERRLRAQRHPLASRLRGRRAPCAHHGSRAAPWPRAASVPGPEPSRSSGRAGSARRRAMVKVGDSTWTVGVLVQSNFGGASELTIVGVPVGRVLGRSGRLEPAPAKGPLGSIMVVVATDAPLSDRNLRRLASRAMLGIGRTGSGVDNGSGDYVIAFSTNTAVRRPRGAARITPGRRGQRRDVGALRGRGRGDGGGDLQQPLHGDHPDRQRPHRVGAIPVDRGARLSCRSRGALGSPQ